MEPISAQEIPQLANIELLFFAYRDFTADPDRILQGFGFGRAHHRVLYFVNRQPGMTVAELLTILGITKQSLVARAAATDRCRPHPSGGRPVGPAAAPAFPDQGRAAS